MTLRRKPKQESVHVASQAGKKLRTRIGHLLAVCFKAEQDTEMAILRNNTFNM